MKQTALVIRKLTFVVFSLVMALTSCSKKDAEVSAPAAPFAGSYLVVDDNETYTLKIENTGGNNFQIRNFGGFMNVPIKANANGNALNIPSQTFTNPRSGKSITIIGSGSLLTKSTKDDTIKFTYTVSGFTNYSSDFEGSRK